MFENNRRIIIEEIIKQNLISRADLAKRIRLNKATITTHINQLIALDLVIESELDISSGGRRPILLSLNNSAGYALGIDITNKCIFGYLINLNGEIINKVTVTYLIHNYKDLISKLITLIETNIKAVKRSTYGLIGVGISIHGLVTNNQIIQFTHKLPQYNLFQDLSKNFPELNFIIDNNANLAAIAEMSYNENITDNFLYLTILSGLGLGIIFNNQLYRGSNGLAGEFGHTIIEINGRSCTCGNQGCLEQYASIPALLKTIGEIKNQAINFNDLKLLLELNDNNSIEKVKEFTKFLTIGLYNLIQLFNTEKIIIESEVYTELLRKMLETDLKLLNTKVEFSVLKDNPSAIGAGIMQIVRFLKLQRFTKQK